MVAGWLAVMIGVKPVIKTGQLFSVEAAHYPVTIARIAARRAFKRDAQPA
jgi:hypothetical protein